MGAALSDLALRNPFLSSRRPTFVVPREVEGPAFQAVVPSEVEGPVLPLFLLLLNLDLDVHASGQIELRQRVHRLCAAVENVDHTLVRLQLELLARLLVDVR